VELSSYFACIVYGGYVSCHVQEWYDVSEIGFVGYANDVAGSVRDVEARVEESDVFGLELYGSLVYHFSAARCPGVS
jgi:hypothetical protein